MPKRNLIWVAITIIVAVAAIVLTRPRGTTIMTADEAKAFGALIQVHKIAQDHYYRDIPDEAGDEVVDSYLRALDPFSRYFPPEQFYIYDRNVNGKAVELGIRYLIGADGVSVLGVVPGSPAAAGGIESGDLIASIDGEKLSRPTRDAVEKLLSGRPGTTCQIELIDTDEDERTVTLTREPFDVEAVVGVCRVAGGGWEYILDSDYHIGYIRIAEFSPHAGDEFEQAFVSIQRQIGEGGLILDLRDNPGGRIESAVQVANRFIDKGLIVATKGLHEDEMLHNASADRTDTNVRLVVLVNGGTASAGEVVAGALKEHRRALLIGSRTFGKRVVQKSFALGTGMGRVLLSTSRYYFETPEEEEDSAVDEGLDPMLAVEMSADAAAQVKALWYRLEVIVRRPPSTSQPASVESSRPDVDLWKTVDPQLAKALDLLRQGEAFDAVMK